MIATKHRRHRTPHTGLFAAAFAVLAGAAATLALLAVLTAALLALGITPATDAPGAQDRAAASFSAAPTCTPDISSGSPCTRPASTLSGAKIAVGCCVAAKGARGGAGPVRVGQAGEDAVRGAYDIGPKVPIRVGGRGRIPDGLTTSTLSEVKNVASLSYSRQLRDYVSYAQQTGRQVDLYVRGGASPTRLSGPLRDALRDPSVPINLRFIP